MIYAMLLDGTRWYYEKDVTDQIPTDKNPRRVRIVIDELPLPNLSSTEADSNRRWTSGNR